MPHVRWHLPVLAASVIGVILGCSGAVTEPIVPPPPPAPVTLDLQIDSVDLASIGSTRRVVPVLVRGTSPASSPIAWSVGDRRVATVSQDGTLSARGNGRTWVIALADSGGRDSAVVRVQQRVASVTVSPATLIRPMQRTAQYSATAFDSGGTVVAGVPFTWTSTSPAVADFGSAGTATTKSTGGTTVRASAEGATGSASLTVTPLPPLRLGIDTIRVGAGQLPMVLLLPTDSLEDGETVDVALSIADTSIAAAPVTVRALAHSYAELLVTGRRAGVTRLTACAARFVCSTATIVVSAPRLAHFAAVNLSTDPRVWGVALGSHTTVTVSIKDSAGTEFRPASALVITGSSTDSTIVSPAGPSTMTANAYVGSLGIVANRTGQATLVMTSPGYLPDSIRIEVVPATMWFYGGLMITPLRGLTMGAGQQTQTGSYSMAASTPLGPADTVTFTQRHPELVSLAKRQIVSADFFSVPFDFTGLAPGVDTVTASVPGRMPASIVVRVTTPTVTSPQPSDGYATDGPHTLLLNIADSLGLSHISAAPQTFDVRSSDSSVVRPTAPQVELGRVTPGTFFGLEYRKPGTATVTVSDPSGRSRPYTSAPITVRPSFLVFAVNGQRTSEVRSGTRQGLFPGESNRLAAVAGNSPSALTYVRFRSTNTDVARVASADTTFQRTTGASAFLDVQGGDVAGTAWIVAEGSQLITDSIRVTVTQPQMAVRKDTGEFNLLVEFFNDAGQPRFLTGDVVLQLSSTDSTILSPLLPTVTARAGTSSVSFKYRVDKYGAGAIRVTDTRTGDLRYPAVASEIIHVFGAP